MPVKNYRDLIVWQKAMELVEEIYRETKCFPSEETYGLKMQLRKPLYLYHPTYQRDRGADPKANSFITSQLPMVL